MSTRAIESTKFGRIVAGVDFATYRAAAWVNVSSLKEFSRSPLHYRYAKDNPKPDASKLPVAGVEATRKVQDASRPSNTLIERVR